MQTFPSNLTFIISYQSILSCPEMSDFSGERHNSSDANFSENFNNAQFIRRNILNEVLEYNT